MTSFVSKHIMGMYVLRGEANMFVRNIENFLEKYIEGFFNQKFSSNLQMIEIFKRLEKEIYLKKYVKDNETYIPDFYMIYLSESDYQILYSEEMCNDLVTFITKMVLDNSYKVSGTVIVKCHFDKKLKKGCFYIEPEYSNHFVEGKKSDNSMHTIVFQRQDLQASKNLNWESNYATLTVIDGMYEDKIKLDLGNKRINIGRRKNNEITLTDINTSRLHAYILPEEPKQHIIHDANSLNGLFVNGQRIDQCILHHGDKIKLGNTVILYEVK